MGIMVYSLFAGFGGSQVFVGMRDEGLRDVVITPKVRGSLRGSEDPV